MGTEAPNSIVIPVHCAPKKAPCPHCGKRGRRKRTCNRTVRTVAYKAVAVLEVTYGEYDARCECCTSFRNNPDGEVAWPRLRGHVRSDGWPDWRRRQRVVGLCVYIRSGKPRKGFH